MGGGMGGGMGGMGGMGGGMGGGGMTEVQHCHWLSTCI